MARGLVVVGPDAGGTGELLREAESPFRFEAGDAEGFRNAVLKALECDWRTERERSRSLALRYGGWDEAIGRMVKRYSARLGVSPAARLGVSPAAGSFPGDLP